MNLTEEQKSLVNNVLSTFVKQEVDKTKPSVIAAILTASSEMAKCSEVATEEGTLVVLGPLFNPEGNKDIQSLVGMSPNYVRSNIGYSVDFRDPGMATVNYQAQKEQYDQIYNEVARQMEQQKGSISK